MRKTWLAASVMAALMAACGGSDGDTAPAVTGSPEGLWHGATSEGVPVSLAVLEDGSTWGLYMDDGSFSGVTLLGALIGETTARGNQLSGEGVDIDLIYGEVTEGSFAGTFVPNDSMTVTLSDGTKFEATYDDDYDRPASLDELAGFYYGFGATGYGGWQEGSIHISDSGQITMPDDGYGCSATGIAEPRPTGKNIFNISVTFIGSNCALLNGPTVNGVAYYSVDSQELVAMALNPSQTDGLVYVGGKVAVAAQAQ